MCGLGIVFESARSLVVFVVVGGVEVRLLKYFVIVFCCVYMLRPLLLLINFFATFIYVRVDSSFICWKVAVSRPNHFIS